MKFRMAIAAIAVALGIGAAAASADAATINVDLDATNPVNEQSVSMGAGVWSLKAVGGGTFGTAWHPWSYTTVGDPPGKELIGTGFAGWVNIWSYSVDGGSTYTSVNSPFVYATSASALSEAPEITLTLPTSQAVWFKIVDSPYSDNTGGLRVALNQIRSFETPSPSVPVPAAGGLLLLGLMAVAARRRF